MRHGLDFPAQQLPCCFGRNHGGRRKGHDRRSGSSVYCAFTAQVMATQAVKEEAGRPLRNTFWDISIGTAASDM